MQWRVFHGIHIRNTNFESQTKAMEAMLASQANLVRADLFPL